MWSCIQVIYNLSLMHIFKFIWEREKKPTEVVNPNIVNVLLIPYNLLIFFSEKDIGKVSDSKFILKFD